MLSGTQKKALNKIAQGEVLDVKLSGGIGIGGMLEGEGGGAAGSEGERSQAASQSIGTKTITDGAIGTKTSARIPAMVVEDGDTFV